MELKFKKLSDKAVMPIRAHKGDAGLDLTVSGISTEVNEGGEVLIIYHTDLAVEIPEGYVGLLFRRSSIAKKNLAMCNAVGVIDSSYRGEITGKFRTTVSTVPSLYNIGDRFVQLVIVPYLEASPIEVDELSETERGEGGYGSTGEKEISAPTVLPGSSEDKDESTNQETAPEAAAEPMIGSEQA